MDSLTSTILTVKSTELYQDAEYIQGLFPMMVRDDEESSESDFIVLSSAIAIFIFVKVTTDERNSILTLSLSDDDFNDVSDKTRDQASSSMLDNARAIEIRLPGGSTLVMVPIGKLKLNEGRKMFAQSLVSRYGDLENGRTTVESSSNMVQEAQPRPPPTISYDIPNFPSLQMKLLDRNGTRRPLLPNTREPAEFETDLFKGKVLVIVRPQNPAEDDPYWNSRIFSKKKRRLLIQVQGTFKRVPNGTLFAGAEISEQMKLGLLTKGLCKMLLRLVESFNNDVHSSFGDSAGDELAHIVAPAHSFFERVIATPPNETPPKIDEPLSESPESIKERKRSGSQSKWNTRDVFSFSFYSMFIDLPQWKLVSLPASSDLSLKTFWGESLLRICMYEKTNASSQKHLQASIQYAFSIQAKHVVVSSGVTHINDNEEEGEWCSDDTDAEDVIAWSEQELDFERNASNSSFSLDFHGKDYDTQLDDSISIEDKQDLHFFDAMESYSDDGVLTTSQRHPIAAPAATTIGSNARSLCSKIDALCPFRIDLYGTGSKYSNAYAVNWESCTHFLSERSCAVLVKSARQESTLTGLEEKFSPRISSSESMRRCLGLALAKLLECGSASKERFEAFLLKFSIRDGNFLQVADVSHGVEETQTRTLTATLARAISDRHWAQEYAQVSHRVITFYHPEKRKVSHIVELTAIVKIERLPQALSPELFGSYHILVLTTVGRSIYLMFTNDIEAIAWMGAISRFKEQTIDDGGSVSSTDSKMKIGFDVRSNNAAEYLHHSSRWKCKNRRILNCSRFFFKKLDTAPSQTKLHALKSAEDAVYEALRLPAGGSDDYQQQRSFLDSAAELKQANVGVLTEGERLAFYLNVYHTMICHAFLVLGPPDSSLKWISYFNYAAYEVGDDIFSLSELEHCIIRSTMTFPSQFLSRFVIPKSSYSMALTTHDWRINFALNCGSLSAPASVPIYKVAKLQQQLDFVARVHLANVSFRRNSSGDLELSIPKIMKWFSSDFGSSRKEVLERILPFLCDDVRRQLEDCWRTQDCCEIRYLPFYFECRPLTPLQLDGDRV